MSSPKLLLFVLVAVSIAVAACSDDDDGQQDKPLPAPVDVRQEPDGVTLADPVFEPLPGAMADFGRLGGAVYQIEMPDDWNGRLLLYMHGFEELGPEASVSAPDIRRYLIGHGYAWGASSFSSTASIPGRSADETAALWDFFVGKYGRPEWTYVTGESMGGAASHIAAERYPDRFDGALARCGTMGQTENAKALSDFVAAGAYVAGVSQEEWDAAPDPASLIDSRILPALDDPTGHAQFEDIMIELTGGPRMFDREGFHLEEETNWSRARPVVAARIASNAATDYELGSDAPVTSETFNRDVVRFTTEDALFTTFVEGGDAAGDPRMPLLTLHTTGDGQVAVEQAQLLRERVDAAGKGDLLVQRVMRDASHCGFSTAELEVAFEDLVAWVERGERPGGDDLATQELEDLTGEFEVLPRRGTPEGDALPGADQQVTVSGAAMLDGAPFDARFLGARVLRDGLATPCQAGLPPVVDGRYEIGVLAEAQSAGCGAPGAEISLWTFVNGEFLYTMDSIPWPAAGVAARFDIEFSTSSPQGSAPSTVDFSGEVYTTGGDRLPPGTRVEAYVGDVLCGVASTSRTGNFSGYILSVVGPDSVPGCEAGAALTFRLDGEPALETATNDPDASGRLDLTLD